MSADIIQLSDRRPQAKGCAAYDEFVAARSRMVRAWRAWLATEPPREDAADELTGTATILTTLRDLEEPRK